MKPEWAPRVPPGKIRRLYANDAIGVYDEDLIDDVGYALLARCQSFIVANAAVHGQVLCPGCGAIIPHSGHKPELLRCACGWELTWGEYFETIQHRQLSGAEPVLRLFQSYVDHFPSAQSAREKVLLIDRLIHGFHCYAKLGGPTRPVAVNLIGGRLKEVIALLDGLTYGEGSTPGISQTKAAWDENLVAAASRWHSLRG